jgi:hypothetical protein
MIQHVLNFIQQEFKLTPDKIVKAEGDYSNKTYITIEDMKFVLEFGYYGNDIRIQEEYPKFYSDKNKDIMTRLGRGFNVLLGEGKYSDEWVTVDEGETEE